MAGIDIDNSGGLDYNEFLDKARGSQSTVASGYRGKRSRSHKDIEASDHVRISAPRDRQFGQDVAGHNQSGGFIMDRLTGAAEQTRRVHAAAGLVPRGGSKHVTAT
jgi:hypothetical protein